MEPQKKIDCAECCKIVCRICKWEPSGEEAILIQKEILTACPDCGWSPKDDIK